MGRKPVGPPISQWAAVRLNCRAHDQDPSKGSSSPGAAGHFLYSDAVSIEGIAREVGWTSGFADVRGAHVLPKALCFIKEGMNALLAGAVIGPAVRR